ncbi:DUF5462 family protein [Aeromonas salmonicida]|uniref:DUF5462 family protein n=1 Tax=Aeromonas salmonicida TaxID=645 RepID=UPI00279644D7|nr:DUF5462 family protein [Aeromonas salmonicida]MDQ1886567.1 DUF5462 family protein [Aeromonas salmonicida]
MRSHPTSLGLLCLLLLTLWSLGSSAQERVIHWGAVNGQRIGPQQIEVSRLLADPVLWQRPSATSGEAEEQATRLVLADASWQPRPGGGYLTVNQPQWDSRGHEHQVQLVVPVVWQTGGARQVPEVQQVGNELHIVLPPGPLELRADGPLLLRTDKGYRGPLRVALVWQARQ